MMLYPLHFRNHTPSQFPGIVLPSIGQYSTVLRQRDARKNFTECPGGSSAWLTLLAILKTAHCRRAWPACASPLQRV